ncbi:MAG TPA: glucose 1-dehydrogenase, partial [Actinomycetota bacterium]|nr:glucose 1-dehydrogenase [Actinomycetota bacterium]
MKAVTVVPKRTGTAALSDVPEPPAEEGSVLVEAVAVGVCGTDEEIVGGGYGWPPPGGERLVLGHESLGRVVEADAAKGLAPGDLVVGIVRHPDPVPCANCAIGEWDMCRNGRYTEHGIKERDGFMRERYRLEPARTIKVDPSLGELGVLLEPTTIVAKAWEHLDRIGARARWEPRTCLVTGAGPVGLLAAMLGVERGLDVHVLDRVETGQKPKIVDALGAHYHSGDIDDSHVTDYDVVVEATGVGELAFTALRHTAPNGVVALTGISSSDRMFPVDSDLIGEDMVLNNIALFGSVNANRRHYEHAAQALAAADPGWLSS